jgi:hypothetical protein
MCDARIGCTNCNQAWQSQARTRLFRTCQKENGTTLSQTMDPSFSERIACRCNINEHLLTLVGLVVSCNAHTNVELGTLGVSTHAWSHGLQKTCEDGEGRRVVCIDKSSRSRKPVRKLNRRTPGVSVEFIHGSSIEVLPMPCDICFIDSLHVYGQLKRELEHWHASVKHYIVMHDTTVDGERGEYLRHIRKRTPLDKFADAVKLPPEEITRGLWPAVTEFLEAHPEWKILIRYTHNNGLTILQRVSTTDASGSASADAAEISSLASASVSASIGFRKESIVADRATPGITTGGESASDASECKDSATAPHTFECDAHELCARLQDEISAGRDHFSIRFKGHRAIVQHVSDPSGQFVIGVTLEYKFGPTKLFVFPTQVMWLQKSFCKITKRNIVLHFWNLFQASNHDDAIVIPAGTTSRVLQAVKEIRGDRRLFLMIADDSDKYDFGVTSVLGERIRTVVVGHAHATTIAERRGSDIIRKHDIEHLQRWWMNPNGVLLD